MIVSSTITQNSLQRHGQRYCQDCHTDHLGREYYSQFKIQDGVDLRNVLLVRANHLWSVLVSQETQRVVDVVELGGSLPTLEYATIEHVRAEYIIRKSVLEAEIANASSRKANIEGAE